MEKITLVCTSLGERPELLQRMLDTAVGFDDIKLHFMPSDYKFDSDLLRVGMQIYTSDYKTIPDAYNMLIKDSDTELICCFPDDDYFYPEALAKMIEEVHKGIDADVAHFNFRISGHVPPEDKRCWFGRTEYTLGERGRITPRYFEKHNRLPAGSFFRKSAWEKVGGFQGDKCHDWDLWKRMAKAGCTFKYFDHLVYNFVRRENSAWVRQNS